MFQESLVESSSLLRSNNRWPAIASFAAQAVVVAIFIALPILHPEVLYLRPPSIALVPPNLRPTPPPPPPTPPIHVVSAVASLPAPAMAPAASTIRRIAPQTTSDQSEAPNFNNTTISMASSDPMGNITSLGTGPHTSVIPASAPAAHSGPINISKGVMAGMLLAPIHADYPIIARNTRTEGTVVIQAIISKSGAIESAHIISGPPMLQSAAIQAVQAARYRPYMLNGAPTEVETTISINFHIGS